LPSALFTLELISDRAAAGHQEQNMYAHTVAAFAGRRQDAPLPELSRSIGEESERGAIERKRLSAT